MSGRIESYTVTLLDREETPVGVLDGVKDGGKVTLVANSQVKGSGSLTWQRYSPDVDWSSALVKISCDTSDLGRINLGVYTVAAPNRDYDAMNYSRGITLIDKLAILRDEVLTTTYSILPGVNLVQAAVQLIQDLGEDNVQFVPSSAASTNPRVWHPGTALIQVVNDLLDSAGYRSVYTDRNGFFTLTPWMSPKVRPTVWNFAEGPTSLHLPQWQYETSLWEATNRVVLLSQADDAGVVMTSVATNDDPSSPTSTVRMGRVSNPIVEEGVDVASQSALDALAQRKLEDNSSVIERLSFEHLLVPVWYNDAVSFRSSGVSTVATIQRMDITLTPGALVKTEMRVARDSLNL